MAQPNQDDTNTPSTSPIDTSPAPTPADAILTRRSVRKFLPTPVGAEQVMRILNVAGKAPSGSNIQPWHVFAVAGHVKDALIADLLAAHDDDPSNYQAGYKYYPDTWEEPYISRRRATGWGLYGVLGIARGEKERMHAQHARNLKFFDAPIGLIFTIDASLNTGSWLDYGMFIQSVSIAARGEGLHTCAQASFNPYHSVIRKHLPIPEGEHVVCGMSLGYADPGAVENSFSPARESAASYTELFGF